MSKQRNLSLQPPNFSVASELMGRLHDALKDSGYDGRDLERFLVRLLFCLFADDTGIFEPRGSFQDLIESRTDESGSDLGPWLHHLFQVLNTPENERLMTLDEDLKQFPYINGELFSEKLDVPAFDARMRRLLIDACEFNWEAVSPAIFGSLFQSIMTAEQRRAHGAHYTTEKNILKVIQPLFLDDLRDELNRLIARRDTGKNNALKAFHDRLADMRLFDPACGCGNFLVIAYRELRDLEIRVLKAIYPHHQYELDVSILSRVDVDQFYGIEINEWAARIAEVALWMMDHIMNNRLSLEFGEAYARIPLRKAPHIHHADALEIGWAQVLPPEQCTYILGNPPFVGAKYQTDAQRTQVRHIAELGGSGGTLDFVAAWFITAAEYLNRSQASIAFVATNSITQGEQVSQLWPLLFERFNLEVCFAHRTFAWGSDARGKAHVHVVIIGLVHRSLEPEVKRLYSYRNLNGDPVESRHKGISPYLFDTGQLSDRHLVVRELSKPLCSVPPMIIGSKPIDGGYLIFDTAEEREAFLQKEPNAAQYVRPFVGSVEYLNGRSRWILALQNVSPDQLRKMPHVMERLKAVKEYRSGLRPAKKKPHSAPSTPGISARNLTDFPAKFHVTVIPSSTFLTVPEVSSERREYVPIGWLEFPTIPSNLVRVVQDADTWHFGILTSAMHMAWMRQIGGRLESRYRYSINLVYNSFPWPDAAPKQKARIQMLANGVLSARKQFPNSTLADLYDPDVMPQELRKAHRDLDVAVDQLYRKETFAGDRNRVEHLMRLYETLAA